MRRWLPFQIMLAVVLALTLLSLQMVFAQTTPTPTAQPAGQTLQLQRTDTLAALAARFGKSVACLQKANNMAATNTALTGMSTIFIPDKCADDQMSNSLVGTPTPESAESLTTATFTPIASGATKQPTNTPTPSAFSTAFPQPTAIPEGIYTVVYGDRLAKIAEKYGLTVACIASANGISNPDLIYVGQQLRINPNCSSGQGGGLTSNVPVTNIPNPQACQFDRNSGRTAPGDKYTVQAGDSLDFIACDFNVDLTCLKSANPQLAGSSLLMPGDVLTINRSCPIWTDSSLPGTP
ncbi:MAG: LysM peptidoglycan-binding domain-containing protein [Anaerolineaceae bacterium]|nr:LysM peptidoglycan-binding domain-containing protein [Anaerolineaceae bacterium]